MNQTIHLNKPKRDVRAAETREGLPIAGRNLKPQARYVYVTYPKAWEFVDGFGFLPVLKRSVAKPGANGVGRNGNVSRAVSSAIQMGATYIDPKDSRLGEFQDYVRYYDCDTGARWYVDFPQEATVLPGGEILWNADEAHAELLRFRAHLRDSGIVPPMVGEVFAWLVSRAQNRQETLLGRSAQNPHFKKQADEIAATISAMRAEWEKAQGAALAKAKKDGTARKPRRKAAPVEYMNNE